MTEARLRGTAQSQKIGEIEVSTKTKDYGIQSEADPKTSDNSTTRVFQLLQIAVGSLLLLASIYWWNRTPAFDPSNVFESNSGDKLLNCAERFSARVARLEKVCKKLLEDGSPFKDVLINSEVRIEGNVWMRHFFHASLSKLTFVWDSTLTTNKFVSIEETHFIRG